MDVGDTTLTLNGHYYCRTTILPNQVLCRILSSHCSRSRSSVVPIQCCSFADWTQFAEHSNCEHITSAVTGRSSTFSHGCCGVFNASNAAAAAERCCLSRSLIRCCTDLAELRRQPALTTQSIHTCSCHDSICHKSILWLTGPVRRKPQHMLSR